MKKYIREILDELHGKPEKDFIPPVPEAPGGGKTVYLDPPPAPVVPEDLENQELSNDPAQRVKQLDYQGQQNEQRETLE